MLWLSPSSTLYLLNHKHHIKIQLKNINKKIVNILLIHGVRSITFSDNGAINFNIKPSSKLELSRSL